MTVNSNPYPWNKAKMFINKHGLILFAASLISMCEASLAETQLSHRSSYGEVCNQTLLCDRRAYLGCFSGRCDCIKPGEMLYEPRTGKCGFKSGERCKYIIERSDGSKAYEIMDCVENASCGGDGFCFCNVDFAESPNRTCAQLRKLGENCDETSKCSAVSGLICSNSTCQCDPNVAAYSEKERQCVGLLSQSCILSKCTEGARCVQGLCNCNDTNAQYMDGKECVPRRGVNQNCSADAQCRIDGGMQLRCLGGLCSCDPEASIFGTGRRHFRYKGYVSGFMGFEERTRDQCLGKVGKPCVEGFCAPGAFCVYTGLAGQEVGMSGAVYTTGARGRTGKKSYSRNRSILAAPAEASQATYTFEGTCNCLPQLQPSRMGTCGGGLGTRCDSPGACFDGLTCNMQIQQCACRYTEQSYSPTLQKCVSILGGPCNEFTGCTMNAMCRNFPGQSYGRCECQPGCVETAMGACERGYGQPCNTTSLCDQSIGLSCLDNVCQCSSFSAFSPTARKCLGLVGAPCQKGRASNTAVCIENAVCEKTHPTSYRGSCTCSKGYQVSLSYTCEPITDLKI